MKIVAKKISIVLAVIAVLLFAAAMPAAINALTSTTSTQIVAMANEEVLASNDIMPATSQVPGTTDETTPEETGETSDDSTGMKALAAGIAIGFATLGAAIGMGVAIAKSNEGISRQPEAEGKIRGSMMLGLIFIETVVIYALIVAILIIFVL